MHKTLKGANRLHHPELKLLGKAASRPSFNDSGSVARQVKLVQRAMDSVRRASIRNGNCLLRNPTFATHRIDLLTYKFKKFGINWSAVRPNTLPELTPAEKAGCEAEIEAMYQDEFDPLDPSVRDPSVAAPVKTALQQLSTTQVFRMINNPKPKEENLFVSHVCAWETQALLTTCDAIEKVRIELVNDPSFFVDQRNYLSESLQALRGLPVAAGLSAPELVAVCTTVDEIRRAGSSSPPEPGRIATIWKAYKPYRDRKAGEPIARKQFRSALGL